MRFLVRMLAHMDGEIRAVHVPDDEIPPDCNDLALLDLIYVCGQNHVQPVPDRCSVSAGDVVVLGQPDGSVQMWMCCSLGWRLLSLEEYQQYVALPRRDRLFSELVRG